MLELSSMPPSKDEKSNHSGGPKKPRRGRLGVTRVLAERLDRIIKATLGACLSAGAYLDHLFSATPCRQAKPILTTLSMPTTRQS